MVRNIGHADRSPAKWPKTLLRDNSTPVNLILKTFSTRRETVLLLLATPLVCIVVLTRHRARSYRVGTESALCSECLSQHANSLPLSSTGLEFSGITLNRD